jgi:hypothetical protein
MPYLHFYGMDGKGFDDTFVVPAGISEVASYFGLRCVSQTNGPCYWHAPDCLLVYTELLFY